MSVLPDNQYKISNVQFATQNAGLLDGQPTAAIAGFQDNTGKRTANMVWNLKNIPNQVNQFMLINAAPTSKGIYASLNQITPGVSVHAGPNAVVWTVIPASKAGQYWILAPSELDSTIPIGLVWSLARNTDRAQIKLAPIALNDLSQLWTFRRERRNV